MYSKKDFISTKAQEVLKQLIGKYKFSEEGVLRDDVNNVLEKVIFDLNLHEEAPLNVITRALYEDEETGKLTHAKFTVRPSSKCALKVDDCKHSFRIVAGANFYDTFIMEMAKWFDNYAYLTLIESNLNELNAKMDSIITANNLDMKIEFTLGDGIVDATDKYLKAGIGVDVVQNLNTLPLFDTVTEEREIAYSNQIVDTLKELNRPYELLKTKSLLTKDLGLYTRRTVFKMLRDFTNRKLEFVRTGVGYIDDGDTFALVSKVAVRECDIPEDLKGKIVTPIVDATAKEKKAGLTHIISSYKVSPFNKEDGTPVEFALADIVG